MPNNQGIVKPRSSPEITKCVVEWFTVYATEASIKQQDFTTVIFKGIAKPALILTFLVPAGAQGVLMYVWKKLVQSVFNFLAQILK